MLFGKKEPTTNIRTTSQAIETIIGQGVIFEGKIHGSATIRVDGNVIGDTDIEGCVIIGETGSIIGDVKTDRILIAGQMTGQITATERVEIVSGGNLTGDIVTKSFVVADGALFEGNCSMKQRPAEAPRIAERTGFAGENAVVVEAVEAAPAPAPAPAPYTSYNPQA